MDNHSAFVFLSYPTPAGRGEFIDAVCIRGVVMGQLPRDFGSSLDSGLGLCRGLKPQAVRLGQGQREHCGHQRHDTQHRERGPESVVIRNAAEDRRGHPADRDRQTERDARGEPDVVRQVRLARMTSGL